MATCADAFKLPEQEPEEAPVPMEQLDPDAASWLARGEAIPIGRDFVTVQGQLFSAQDCFVNALKLDNTNSVAWSRLANTMPRRSVVDVLGKVYTKQQCFYNALKLDMKTNSEAWCGIGFLLPTNGRITLDSVSYSKQDCFVMAVRIDVNNAYSWSMIAASLPRDGHVDVNGDAYTKPMSWIQAVKLDPGKSRSWCELGRCLPSEGLVDATSKEKVLYTKLECFATAIQLDKKNWAAWGQMVPLVPLRSHVLVKGLPFSKVPCFINFVRYSWRVQIVIIVSVIYSLLIVVPYLRWVLG